MSQPRFRQILIIATNGLVALVTCYLILLGFLFGPILIYGALSPAVEEECSSVRQQMTREQVISLFHRKVLPDSEASTMTSRLVFGRSYETCVIDIDPQTQKVTGSSVVKSDLHGSE